ncbi:hypothetical protein PCC7418_1723 [Halothece sp. PCC 7418]|uniref:hypothetical protein n=1 Tax=Halothece sp. (strain PCC 7418) TaxID=65093 RepID=UPI0002A05AB4|nr:hypothetical protein [Halothece sp. PCC 7418]AFZ43892.1 hypothetical protein PCC7418_1723 [Halothece sp. PCC 7418]
MKHRTSVYHTVITTGTVLTSLPVLAHAGHFEKTETETKTQTEEKSLNNQQNQPTSSENQPIETQTNLHEEQPTTQTQTITIAKITTVGETLLGLIIVTPFLLYALKKRIHRYG